MNVTNKIGFAELFSKWKPGQEQMRKQLTQSPSDKHGIEKEAKRSCKAKHIRETVCF